MPVLISVVMPAYNAQQYIAKAIESVLAQTFPSWELIIVDDGSTDATAQIVKGYEEKDSRIKYHYQANKKQASARNLGISLSKGYWIGFLDADDLWLPNKLEVQKKYTDSGVADVYFSSGFVIDENDKILYDYKTIKGNVLGPEMYKKLYEWNPIPILSVLINAKLVEEAGPQDENPSVAQSCEDWDYWIRLSKLNKTFFGIDEKLFLYRLHSSSTSQNSLKMQLGQALIFLKNFDEVQFNRLE